MFFTMSTLAFVLVAYFMAEVRFARPRRWGWRAAAKPALLVVGFILLSAFMYQPF